MACDENFGCKKNIFPTANRLIDIGIRLCGFLPAGGFWIDKQLKSAVGENKLYVPCNDFFT